MSGYSIKDQKALVTLIVEASLRELSRFEEHLIIYTPKFKKQIKSLYSNCSKILKNYLKKNKSLENIE